MNVLSVGQIGWDVTTINGKTNRNYGGSVLHFCLAAALMGIKTDMLCYVNKEEWKDLIKEIQQFGIGTNHIIDFEHTIQFNMYYDKELNFCEEMFSMDISDSEPHIYECIPYIGQYDLYNICETVPEQDFKTLQIIATSNRDAAIAMQLHIDNLLRNRKLYLSLLDKIDYIFMNYEEASFLSGCNSLEDTINFLKKRIKNVAFITSHSKNYAVSNREVIKMNPMSTNKVVDPTGAGDCFAGGAIAGLCLSGQLETALRFGSMCSYFKLKEYSSNYLLKMLKVWRV